MLEKSSGKTVVVPSGWWMAWYYNTEPTIALHKASFNALNEMEGGRIVALEKAKDECEKRRINSLGNPYLVKANISPLSSCRAVLL